jgi:RND family efflux transporter MFP subunit
MGNAGGGPAEDGRRRLAKVLGGLCVFAAVGCLLLLPGVFRRTAATPPESAPPPARLARHGSLADPAGRGETAEHLARRVDAAPAPRERRRAGAAPSADLGLDAFECMILASEVVEVGSPVPGLVEQVLVERGDYVTTGQVVAQLESSVEQAAVRVAEARAGREGEIESAEANLVLGERRRERAEELFERASLSLDARQHVETQAVLAASELKKARENHRIATLELEQARAALKRRTIRSPFAGFVVQRSAAPGAVVVEEESLLRIAQVDPLRVEVILPSRWFGRLHAGDAAEVRPEAPLDEPRSARVALVDPVVDGASGTFGARLLLPNPEHRLPAGLRCQVRFPGKTGGGS